MHRKRFLRITAVITLLLYSLPGLAASQYWATANPLTDDTTSSGNLTLYGAYYSASTSTTIAVGERGAILTGTNSTDGSNRVNWVARQSGLTIDLNDVVYDGNKYIAIGWDGIIVTSTNLTDWTVGNVGAKIRLRAIAYAQFASAPGDPVTKHYVVVGDNGSLLTSTDSVTWTAINSGTGVPLLDILWDGVKFIAVGGNSSSGIVLTSSDGITWSSPQFVGSHLLHGITYNGSKYIAVGDAGTIHTSTNGTGWTPVTPPTNQDLYAVAYNSTYSKYVAVGSQGTILTSNAGNTWTAVPDSGTTNNLYAISWNMIHIIVAGTNSLLTPTDASLNTWQFGNSPISDQLNLTGIATNDSGTNLAVTATGEVYSSTDGLDWTSVATTAHVFTTLAWDGGQYVAIENGSDILTSPDGVSWTIKQTGVGTGLNGIAYSGTAYVVVGDNDLLQRSTDLLSWSAPTTPAGSGGGNLTGITWNADAGEFLVVTDTSAVSANSAVLHGNASGQIWASLPATEFRIQPLSTALTAVSWNGSQYVAVGPLGAIVYSDNGNDGNDWQHVAPADTFRNLNGVTWSASLERFIAVGDNGIVMPSAGVDMGAYAFSQNLSSTVATELEPFGYSFQARNNGNFYAKNIAMTVTLPAATDAEFGTYDSRCTQSGQSLSCALGNMEGGGGIATSVYVQVTPLAPLVHSDLAVTVDVSADGPEALPNDNQVVTATYVQSMEDKIAQAYNDNLGGTGRLGRVTLGLLLLSLLTVCHQRRYRAGKAE